MNIEKLLLEQVSAINKKYDEIAEITGENYNIFRLLKLGKSEVRLHSAFIKDLLDTEGSHGLKDVFLKAFINVFKISGFNIDEIIDAKASKEFSIGYISEDYNSGGRVDILIEANNRIIIENKIDHGDEFKQLVRYRGKYSLNTDTILYLTLDGKDPDKSSITKDDGAELKKDIDFRCVSYKIHIKEWLEKCKEKAVNHPILRETITQYINLIKHLTHQTMSDLEKETVIDLIIDKTDFIESAQKISDSWEDVKAKIMDKVKNDIWERINKKSEIDGLTVEFSIGMFGENDSFCTFRYKEWKYYIYFCFEGKFGDFSIGIYKLNDENFNNEEREYIKSKLSSLDFGKDYKEDDRWAWAQYIREWDTEWKNIMEILPGVIIKDVKSIIECFENEIS